eukprot:280186_1
MALFQLAVALVLLCYRAIHASELHFDETSWNLNEDDLGFEPHHTPQRNESRLGLWTSTQALQSANATLARIRGNTSTNMHEFPWTRTTHTPTHAPPSMSPTIDPTHSPSTMIPTMSPTVHPTGPSRKLKQRQMKIDYEATQRQLKINHEAQARHKVETLIRNQLKHLRKRPKQKQKRNQTDREEAILDRYLADAVKSMNVIKQTHQGNIKVHFADVHIIKGYEAWMIEKHTNDLLIIPGYSLLSYHRNVFTFDSKAVSNHSHVQLLYTPVHFAVDYTLEAFQLLLDVKSRIGSMVPQTVHVLSTITDIFKMSDGLKFVYAKCLHNSIGTMPEANMTTNQKAFSDFMHALFSNNNQIKVASHLFEDTQVIDLFIDLLNKCMSALFQKLHHNAGVLIQGNSELFGASMDGWREAHVYVNTSFHDILQKVMNELQSLDYMDRKVDEEMVLDLMHFDALSELLHTYYLELRAAEMIYQWKTNGLHYKDIHVVLIAAESRNWLQDGQEHVPFILADLVQSCGMRLGYEIVISRGRVSVRNKIRQKGRSGKKEYIWKQIKHTHIDDSK